MSYLEYTKNVIEYDILEYQKLGQRSRRLDDGLQKKITEYIIYDSLADPNS